MRPTVFLIGATGHVGKALVGTLAAEHASGRLRVQAAARSEQSATQLRSAGIEAVPFDLDRRGTFDAALAGVDRLFLLRPYTLKQMMHGKTVADAAKRAGVGHVVTLGAYGAAQTPWPVIAWNFLVEAYVERLGLPCTHLQPNYFMDNVLAQRDPASQILFNRITVPVSWIASSDIAAVAAAVLADPAPHAGKIYPLAAEVADARQIADWMSEITGQAHRVVSGAREKTLERLMAQGRERDYALALLDYVDAVNRGEVPEIADTFDTVERLTGRPAIKFEAFLEAALRPRERAV